MAKTKKKTKKTKTAPAKKPPVKEITTIEDDEQPPPPPTENIRRLKPFIMSAVSHPVQKHVNDALFCVIFDFLRGDDIDLNELERTLCNIKIGNKPLFEVVEKIEEIGKFLSKIK